MRKSKNVLNPVSSDQSPKSKSGVDSIHLAMNIMKKCDTNLDDQHSLRAIFKSLEQVEAETAAKMDELQHNFQNYTDQFKADPVDEKYDRRDMPIRDFHFIAREKRRADEFEHEHFSGPHVIKKDPEVNKLAAKLFITEQRKPADTTWKPEPIKLNRQVTTLIDSSQASFRSDLKKINKK